MAWADDRKRLLDCEHAGLWDQLNWRLAAADGGLRVVGGKRRIACEYRGHLTEGTVACGF